MARLIVFLSFLMTLSQVFAATAEEEELARQQQLLNQEVMSQPFLAEQPEKVNAYIEDAMKRKLKPPEYTGSNWRTGYTCRNLLAYSWREYRNCRYYHHYYGRYYY